MSLEGEEEGKIYIWSVIILQWRKLSAFVKKTCRMEDITLWHTYKIMVVIITMVNNNNYY